MKKLISKISFGAILSLIPMVAGAVSDGYNSDYQCYIIDRPIGADSFYFCGDQTKSCKGDGVNRNDSVHWQQHGDSLDREGLHWCCMKNPRDSGSGRYVPGDKFIVEEKTVNKSITDSSGNVIGKCSWLQKTNVCGWVENPEDECFEATGECEQGYVSHNKKCVKACQTGYAFASETDNNCVKVDKNNPTQGTKGGSIVQCAENEFYDKKTSGCIPQTERIQVSTMAFTQCWKCDSPYLLKQCLLDYSKNGTISSGIRSACGITQRTSGQKTFVDSGDVTASGTTTPTNLSDSSDSGDNGDATTSGTTTATTTTGNSGSGNNGGATTGETTPTPTQTGNSGNGNTVPKNNNSKHQKYKPELQER